MKLIPSSAAFLGWYVLTSRKTKLAACEGRGGIDLRLGESKELLLLAFENIGGDFVVNPDLVLPSLTFNPSYSESCPLPGLPILGLSNVFARFCLTPASVSAVPWRVEDALDSSSCRARATLISSRTFGPLPATG